MNELAEILLALRNPLFQGPVAERKLEKRLAIEVLRQIKDWSNERIENIELISEVEPEIGQIIVTQEEFDELKEAKHWMVGEELHAWTEDLWQWNHDVIFWKGRNSRIVEELCNYGISKSVFVVGVPPEGEYDDGN